MSRRRSGPTDIRYPSLHFGRYLAELLEEADMTQAAAANQLEMSTRTLSAYRTGRTLPDLRGGKEVIAELARVLAPSKGRRAAVQKKLTRRWYLDLYHAHLRALEHTPAEGIRYLERLRRE